MKLPFANDGYVRLDLSRDGAHVIASWGEGERERCLWSGRELPSVAWQRGHSPERVWSSGATRRAALARESSGVRVVVSDPQRDVSSASFEDASARCLAFRRSDDRLAYAAKRSAGWFIDREGDEPSGPFDEVFSLAWHDDQLVGVVRVGDAWSVWIEGRLHACSTSHPSVHVAHGAFAIVDGAIVDGAAGRFHVQHGDRRLGPFAVRPWVALGVGDRIVLALPHDHTRTDVQLGDGTSVGHFTRVRSLKRCTGPRGDRLVFAYDRGNHAGMFVDGQHHEGLGYSDGPWWSGDGAHLFWAAERARGDASEALGVLDGHEQIYPWAIHWELGASVRVTPRGEVCVFTLDRSCDAHGIHVGHRSFAPLDYPLKSARREDHEIVAFSLDGAHFAFLRVEEEQVCLQHDATVSGPLPRDTTFSMTDDGDVVVASLDEDASEVTLLHRSLG